MPKRGVNVHENEVMRAYKTVNDNYIEPISFIVPRRSEDFQDDIYPPTTGLKPAMSASEWLAGKEAIPPKISLESVYEGEGLKEVTAAQDKPTSTVSAPQPKPVEREVLVKKAEPEPKPTPVVVRPEPTMKEKGASMAAMVSKFADKNEEEDEDDGSSFEEVDKPTETLPTPAQARAPSPAPAPVAKEQPAEKSSAKVSKKVFSQCAEPTINLTLHRLHLHPHLQAHQRRPPQNQA